MTFRRLSKYQEIVLKRPPIGFFKQHDCRWVLDGVPVTKHVRALVRFGYVRIIYGDQNAKILHTPEGLKMLDKLKGNYETI